MRRSRGLSARIPTIGFVVEADTELWYLQMLKKHEEINNNIRINIKPEIPQKNNLKVQYQQVCELAEVNKIVFWILDFDTILKETRECKKGDKRPLTSFLEYRKLLLKEFENVRVIVNNPCLEYWHLLHFTKNQRFYSQCNDARRALEKKLPGYEKTQRYYKKPNNDIYTRLKPYLKDAIANAAAFGGFDVDEPERAMCEMNVLFMIEELKHCRE